MRGLRLVSISLSFYPSEESEGLPRLEGIETDTMPCKGALKATSEGLPRLEGIETIAGGCGFQMLCCVGRTAPL